MSAKVLCKIIYIKIYESSNIYKSFKQGTGRRSFPKRTIKKASGIM